MDDCADRFAPEALDRPLFIGDVARLQAKFAGADGLLKEYWEDFRRSLADPERRRANLFLEAVFSEDAVPEACGLLRDYWRKLRAGDALNDVQFHTWCRCGSVVRRAVFFDWLAARNAWTPTEIEEAAEAFLGFGFKHAFMVLTARGRSSNNQALSMALYCAVVGFLFGHKLSRHATGKFLFEYGMGRLPDLIGLFPGDGYGGEGSTYTSHVNTPLTFWTAEFLRQTTGREWLDTPFRPNGTTLRKMLEVELRILGPAGLLAPWDHYGWQHAVNASPFAYLARATEDPRYLSLIPALDLWPPPGGLAWGADDQLWTLVWWPPAFRMYDKRGLPGELFGWCLPKTGAALDDPARRARLMQVWDFSASTIAGIGRAQVNPNHVTFEIGGEPVLTDGIPAPDTDPWHYPVDKVFERLDSVARARYAKYMGGINAGHTAELENIARGLAPGLIGGANAIVLDDQPWYWPGETRTGKAVFYAKTPEMQVVTSDATAFYRPTYDVTRMRRTSLWTDAGFGIILDDCEAESAHTWIWQAYLRPDTVLDGSTAHVRLPNGKSVLIVWTPACDCRLVDVAGFPRTEECRSKRLELTKRGTHAAFSVMIAPGARAGRVKQVSKHLIEIRVDDRIHLLLLDQHSGESTRMYGRQTTAPYAWHKPEGRLVEIHDGLTPEATPDVHDLPDIAADRDLQLPEFEALCKWTAERTVPAASRLSQLDACLAEIPQAVPGTAGLEAALRSPHWPVQCAAAEVVGRARMHAFAPMLRELLAAEHAIPEAVLYPPVNSTPQPEDAPPPPPGADAEAPAKRWRLRTALIVALGRLGDRESVPLLHAILADGHDFYPVYSVAAQALGRIGGDDARAALATALAESEVNTHTRAQFALQALGGQS